MNQSDGRRSFLQRLVGVTVAGKIAAFANPAIAAEKQVESAAGTEKVTKPYIWRGKAVSVTLRHHPDGNPDHYQAEVYIRNGVSVLDRNGKRKQKSDKQLHTLLLKR
ncbi:MAG: hypothetical protein ACR2J8_02635, partial [Thermomicrobiales bacterium]